MRTKSSGTVNFRVEGGHKLSGEITVRTSKNGAVGVMCASLLNKGATVIKNAPKIEEVNRISETLQSIGVTIEWRGSDLVIKPPKRFTIDQINYESAAKTRSAIMLLAPLIHELKKFRLPQAGGCRLGSRTVKPFVYALERLGVSIETTSDYYEVSRAKLRPNEIVLYEAGDMVTEAALMAAARIPGRTIIRFASANYQVQDVCLYLKQMGVKVDGIGTSTLTVHGKEHINVQAEYALSEDPIEAMSLIAAAIVTKSSITIRRCPIDFLELELLKLEKMGFKYDITKRYIALNGHTRLVDIKTRVSKLVALEEKIHALPYPGINM
ncbi:MAG: UDP-N-acetylglucosamine 1-carboxyvinyltransferase, partial [Candidatus Parcubacteria bacterium]|nr:UDP-N-acetylglucosamine 1-carboxyvinyltransferase [Candidatus Parcubacteria bacterium]